MVKKTLIAATLCFVCTANADTLPPNTATATISPNGDQVVRVSRTHAIRYSYDTSSDSFSAVKRFKLRRADPQFAYVSDRGDIVFAYLFGDTAIEWYDKDGGFRRSWKLTDFLSDDQQKDCAKTASTIQWIDEGVFYDREFVVRGPSSRVRQVVGSYTLTRDANPEDVFAFSLDCASGKLVEVIELPLEEGTEP